jgi:hypothetical protein
MVYKDKTWCRDRTCKHWDTCDTALTLEVQADAMRWWGGVDVPISVQETRFNCYEAANE